MAASVAAMTAFTTALPGAAQIYKWVDESGTVHFSDAPPARAGGGVEVIPESAPRPRPTEPARDAAADADDLASRRDAAESSDAEPVDEAAGDGPPVVEDVVTEVIVESGPDPAVRRRANSPRNRPGEPIRQPARQPVQRPARGR
jgi:hypothetical protein